LLELSAEFRVGFELSDALTDLLGLFLTLGY